MYLFGSAKRKLEVEDHTTKQPRPSVSALSSTLTPVDSSATNSPAQVRPDSPIQIDEVMATPVEFQPAATWAKVQELIITSKEFTSRDKKEILAQSATFEGLVLLKQIASAEETPAKKATLNNMYNQASKQLALYYLVGMYGWGTAVNTIKSDETSSLGVPQPIFKPANNVIYVKSNNAPNYAHSSNSNAKKKGRQSYKKH